MMNNLFSIFDPMSSMKLSLNWVSLLCFSFMITPSLWLMNPSFKVLMKKVSTMLQSEFSVILKSSKINIIMFVSLFLLIMFNNIMSLFSFTFTATSHLAITLALALPMWVGFMIFSLINNITNFLAHLVPNGTPPVLMPFMVIIEIISSLIRPITLSVRLAANMIAGHLLMTLLGSQIVSSMWIMFPVVGIAQLLLMMLESAVAIIQAYVFSVLSTLYASEA